MKEDIHEGIEKYRYGFNYFEYKIRNIAHEYKWLKSERSKRTEIQIQYSQYHLTNQRNPNYSKVFNRLLNDKKKKLKHLKTRDDIYRLYKIVLKLNR